MDWQREVTDPTEFVEGLKLDLFQDQVFVFTPKGDVKDLPRDATPSTSPTASIPMSVTAPSARR